MGSRAGGRWMHVARRSMTIWFFYSERADRPGRKAIGCEASKRIRAAVLSRWGASVTALAAFVHDANVAWQGVIFSPSGSALLTNAVHVHVGGGL